MMFRMLSISKLTGGSGTQNRHAKLGSLVEYYFYYYNYYTLTKFPERASFSLSFRETR